MKFKITSVNCNNQPVIHYYDNITQDIWTDKMIPICLSQDPRCSDMLVKLSHKFNCGDIIGNNLKELRIQLGLNCNFHCKYCNQAEGAAVEKKVHRIKLPDDVRVRYLINQLKTHDIKPNKIALWGGEPLVYWKLIEKLVPPLRELYPDALITMISNGSLITRSKIDFMLKHKIKLTVSHDGPSFEKYRNDKNPLEDSEIVNNLLYYDDEIQKILPGARLSFNVVVTPENCDLEKNGPYFLQKMGREVRFHYEGIAKLSQYASHIITKFDATTKKILLNNLFKFGITDPKGLNHDLRDTVSYFLKIIINQWSLSPTAVACDVANSDVLAVTLDGNVLACHGADAERYTIGRIEDLGTIKNNKVNPWNTMQECTSCPLVRFCVGGCAIQHQKDRAAACENLKLWNMGLFAAAWYILFNVVIQKIEPMED